MIGTLSVKQAAEETGANPVTILRHIRRGTFSACKPLSDRGGWRIFEEPFRRWWSSQVGATSNGAQPTTRRKQR